MTWAVTGTLDAESAFDDHIRAIITRESLPLPPQEQEVGPVTVRWEDVGRKLAFIQSVGGTVDDRLLIEAMVEQQLLPHGYRRASWSFDDEFFRKEASWDDIMAKAKRLIQSGNVRILRNGYNNIVAQVKGDHGTYQPEIFRQDPNSRAITGSDCECGWSEFQNTPRTRQWKKYQDRPCSHILAAYWSALATPLDEDINPAAPSPAGGGPGGQMSLFPTQPGGMAGTTPGGFRLSPAAPSGQISPDQGMLPGMGAGPQGAGGAPMGPSPADLLPQFPMGNQPPVNPASIPGLKGPTPTSPVSLPAGLGGAFSSWQHSDTMLHMADEAFTGQIDPGYLVNGNLVQLRYDDTANLVGRSEEHGAGQETNIPAGSVGEILGTEPSTGMVNVLWMGKQFDANKQLQPFGAQGWHFQHWLQARPDLKRPGPAVRRAR